MKKANARMRLAGILVTVVAVTICVSAMGVFGSAKQTQNAIEIRADILPIDSMKLAPRDVLVQQFL